MRTMNVIATALAALALASCSKDIEMKYPPKFELPELPEVGEIHSQPLKMAFMSDI